MSPGDFSDELFESATAMTSGTPASQQLRDTVLRQTTRTIRNRRRMRRVSIAAALAACYLCGIATMSLWSSACGANQVSSESTTVVAQNISSATGAAREPMRPEDDQIIDNSTLRTAVRLTPYERLCRTGDEQLKNQNGMVAAARSYKKALQQATVEQRSIDPDRDTWLLMALKQSI